jgi:GNAT superfamily N-acetyltransferase
MCGNPSNLPKPNSPSSKKSGTTAEDGHEVDGVFTLEEFRGRGLARFVVQALIDACGHEVLYMHSTLQLISFYKTFGFVPIPKDPLPKMIKDRFIFCFGEMAGCNVCPMRRVATI